LLAAKPQRVQACIPPDARIKKKAGEFAGTGFDFLGGHRLSSLYRASKLAMVSVVLREWAAKNPHAIPGAKISVCHGVGGMFAASGTIIMSNERP
jgi:hypothetical protein